MVSLSCNGDINSVLQAINLADMVVVMEKGHMKWLGSPSDSAFMSHISFLSPNEFNTFSEIQDKGKSNSSESKKGEEVECVSASNEAENIIEAETRKVGRVDPTVYR